LLLGGINPVDVFLVLTSSSIIGGYIAYYLGYSGRLLKKLKKTPEKYQQKSVGIMSRYGWATVIFFSPWIPILGDVVSIVAGTKRYSIIKYTVTMTTGKTVKAFAIVYFSFYFIHWLTNILH